MKVSLNPLREISPADAVAELTARGIPSRWVSDDRLTGEIGAASALAARRGAEGQWLSVSVAVDAEATPADVTRVNRLLTGWAAVPAPKIERNWRKPNQLRAILGGGLAPLDCPVTLRADLNGPAWSVTRLGTPTAPAVTPTVTPTPTAVAPVSPTVAPAPAPAATQTAPTVTQTAPTSGGQMGASASGGTFTEGEAAPSPIHLNPTVEARVRSALTGFTEGERTFLLMRGPAGSGKTETVFRVAADLGLPLAVFHVQGMQDFSDWAGMVMLTEVNGATVSTYVPSQFAEAVSIDGPYAGRRRIVLLDEITRAVTSSSQSALLPILDRQRRLYIPDARRTLIVDPAVCFAATANIGRDYTGTIELDAALADRVTCWARVDYPTPETEATILIEQAGVTVEDAERLVRVAQMLRDMASRLEVKRGISTRALIESGKHLRRGITTPIDAVLAGFGDYYSDEGGSDSDLARATAAIGAVMGGAQ